MKAFGKTGGADGSPGADGDGFTGGSYSASTGVVTFTSDDGLGFSTSDLRGAAGPAGNDGAQGPQGVAGSDGANGVDGLGFTGGSYDAPTGVVTFTSDDGLGFSTTDLRGADGAQGPAGNDGAVGADGDTVLTQTEAFEESASLSTTTGSGFQWGLGNGDEIPQNEGASILIDGAITEIALQISEGSATVELYLNGAATGQSVSASGTAASAISSINVSVSKADLVNFRTTSASGNTNGGRASFLATTGDLVVPININSISDVDNSGATAGQILTYGADGIYRPQDAAGGTDESVVGAIAAGSTLGLQQELLANAGQPGLTVLAVGFTNTGKVQGVSLGAGNVVEVYANGADFNAGTVLYREFMSFGEPICFTGLSNGALITATQGFYGFSEQVLGVNESPMPLLSYGLAFKSTFFFGFRNSSSLSSITNQGTVRVVNGPLKSLVTLRFGTGAVVNSQQDISLDPWEFTSLQTQGNTEYILESTNPIMACVHARTNVAGDGGSRFYDSRLIMPLTNDGITWPRSGFVSAPFDNTVVDWYTRDNAEGSLNSGLGVSPGSPIDFDASPPVGTGADDQDYEPNGATRVLATGLISAYSGADSAGNEASPLMPTKAMSQVVAQPLYIADNGDGGNSGVAIASPFAGEAKVFAWNSATSQLDLAYTVPLTRNGVTIASKDDQNHPSAGLVSNDGQASNTLVGQLGAGVIVANVPITAVVQNGNSGLAPTLRSQNGTTTTALINDDDETLSLGITPELIKAEIREGTDGILYRREIGAGGTDTWVVA